MRNHPQEQPVENALKSKPYSSAFSIPARIREGIRNGDAVAFAEYYEGVQDALVYFIARLIGDRDEALNIVHDAFVKLWENREKIDKLNGFLYTAATNGSLDLLRKRRVHTRYLTEQMFLQSDVTAPADQSLVTRELEIRIEETIEKMPPQRRKVFMMSREENLTYNEIAERLNISYYTVKEHIEAALKSLRSIATMLVITILLGSHPNF